MAKFSVFLIYIWHSTNINVLLLIFLLKHFCHCVPIFSGSPDSSSIGFLSCYPPTPHNWPRVSIPFPGRKQVTETGKPNCPPAESTAHPMTLLLLLLKSIPHQSDASYLPLLQTSLKKIIWKCHYFTYVLEGCFCSVYTTKCVVIFFQFFKNIISLSLVSTVLWEEISHQFIYCLFKGTDLFIHTSDFFKVFSLSLFFSSFIMMQQGVGVFGCCCCFVYSVWGLKDFLTFWLHIFKSILEDLEIISSNMFLPKFFLLP